MNTRKNKENKETKKTNKTRKQNVKTFEGGNYKARDVYGTMTIPKDSILYHTSYTEFKPNSSKPMLFLTFHPSDWPGEYVARIKIKRDITLLFMVYPGKIHKPVLHPLLDILINKTGYNLNKQKDSNLKCYVKELENEELDGWFSSIEGRTAIEVAIINDTALYDVVETEVYNNNMKNGYINFDRITENSIYVPVNWGSKYLITTLINPVKMNVNSKYKQIIELFQKCTSEGGIMFPIQYILYNASITYFDKEIPNIKWSC